MRINVDWRLCLLLGTAVVVAALVWRFERSPGVRVSRAIVQSAAGQSCMQSILVRTTSGDLLVVEHSWIQNGKEIMLPGEVEFIPGEGISPASITAIAHGQDLGTEQTNATSGRNPSFLQAYHAQVDEGASWLGQGCLPFANPFQARFRAAGAIRLGGQSVQLFSGAIHYHRGSYKPFAEAKVVDAVGTGGVKLEVVMPYGARSLSSSTASVTLIADRIQHEDIAQAQTFSQMSAAGRLGVYEEQYQDLIAGVNAVLPLMGGGFQI